MTEFISSESQVPIEDRETTSLLHSTEHESNQINQPQTQEQGRPGLSQERKADIEQNLQKIDKLAASQYKAGNFLESEALLIQAYNLRLSTFGEDDPATMQTLNNLSSTQARLGKVEEAEMSFRIVLASRDRVLGSNHPDTLVSVNHLGVLYKQQGKLEEAAEHFKRALLGLVAAEKKNTQAIAEVAYNYGVVNVQMGFRRKAATLFRISYEELKSCYGEEHQHTLDALHWELKCLQSIGMIVTPTRPTSTPPEEASSAEQQQTTPTSPSSSTANQSQPRQINLDTLRSILDSDEPLYDSRKEWKVGPACSLCQVSYTMYRREHHCRVCSRSVCNECCTHRSKVLAFDLKNPVRCCAVCEQQGF